MKNGENFKIRLANVNSGLAAFDDWAGRSL
jgi:hypothetical protein